MTRRTAVSRLGAFAAVAAVFAAWFALPASSARPASTHRTTSCWSGYSYDGVQSPTRAYGVGATITLQRPSQVTDGHVAAWIGVGGAGMGPGGSDEWIQAGIAHEADGTDALYYEYKRPGDAQATLVQLQDAYPGVPYSLFVYERAAQRDAWRVMLNGVKVSDPIVLPGSHGAFQPVATAENWDGGVTGACNGYAFDFSSLAIRTDWGGAWQPFDTSRALHDPAYELALRPSGFTASSR
jgi:hypothetical protein